MDNWSRTTDEMIYSMLTESTGTNMLDSGGDSDRHWQRNQDKSFEDFNNEPCLVLLDQSQEFQWLQQMLTVLRLQDWRWL